ncbi:low molecular weight protein-tyrosine-phosphatase [Pseudoalteromonas luteoviolacea]|uniref:low molecular weight protein-tyrosine-phosphatase n=1 Tax=Pseudoalteromonas luteoviolacea TaxID=43657 RepID=UPI001B35ACC0|nr:low molecular weight protein-tyrosine-phosphatase [Pseudoalteromonas luteoviolacea]MBQ4837307.1 low molecular weight phosphotyrosine protein phosphatase [Pseudoalteromonas luteoviolacea]
MVQNHKLSNILVVCMGNICRSPTMEAVLKAKAQTNKLTLNIDSAGTINYHEGSTPDRRSVKAGQKRGYSFSGIYSRPVCQNDFASFDLILCADKHNMADLHATCPTEYHHKIHLFLDYANLTEQEVPDPYYGEGDGFELVLDLIEQASDNIIKRLLTR